MVKSVLLKLLRNLWSIAFLFTNASSVIGASFTDNFDDPGSTTIIEIDKMNSSQDQHWWLSSGAYIHRVAGIATTVQGALADTDRFRIMYARSNPLDTDNGYRPQNLTRFVTRTKFKNFRQQVSFNIDKINTSDSPNRNQSNGVFLFNRYQDSDTVYYAGIRVDGYAVVKKKFNGQYYPLKSVQVYPGLYNRDSIPNILPIKRWIGIKTEISDKADGNVKIMIYLNDDQLGTSWIKVLEVEDTGGDVECILDEGYAGIRSDFMDVSFDSYEASEINN